MFNLPSITDQKDCLFFICFCSVAQSYLNLCDPMSHKSACQTSLSITISQSPSSNSWPLSQWCHPAISYYLILCHPLLLLPSTLPSIRAFSIELALCIRWLKYWNFSFNISPFNEYSGLISFKIDWFDLLAVQRTFKSLLQYQSLMLSVLQCSAFFMVQLSQPHMTTGKTIHACSITSVMSDSLWLYGL